MIKLIYYINTTLLKSPNYYSLEEIPEILIGVDVDKNSKSSNIDCMFLDDDDEQEQPSKNSKKHVDEEEIKNL